MRETLLRNAVIESLEIRTLLSAVYLYGDAGPTAWDIRRVGDNVQIFQNQPLTAAPFMTIPAADNDPIWLYGESGHDTVTVDYSGGDPIAGGLFFEEFSTINNGCTLVVTNTGGAQFTLNRSLLTVAGSDFSDSINFPSNRKPNLSLFGGSESDQLDVVQGSYTFNSDLGAGGATVGMVVGSSAGNTASVLFGVTQHLDSLAIDSGGSVQMRPAGGQVLDTNTLSVNGTLDLSDNDLIVNNPSSSDMTTLQEDVVTGNPVTSGVTTTPEPGSIYASDGPSDGMTLGVAPAADLLTPLTVLDGQAVPSTALVARYTVPGDANLSGVVDGSDLGEVLFNFDRSPGITPPAWYDGDFNYDGTINSSDLFDLLAYFGSSVANATPTTVTAGQTYTLALPAQASGTSAPVIQWDVNWGDGQVDSLTPADATATSTDYGTLYSTTHVYTNTGPVLIQVTEIIQAGTVFHATAIPLAITAASGLTAYTLAAGSTDAINIAGDGLGNTVVRDNGSIVQIIPGPDLLSLDITGDTDGTTTVDFSNGDPLPPSGLSTDSSLVDITGSSGSDTLFTTSTAAVFGNAEIRYPASTALTFLNAGPGDTIAAVAGTVTIAGDTSNSGAGSANGGPTVVVNQGATVLFTGTQHLSALDILPGGTGRMVQYGSYQLVTNSLNISPYQGPPGDLPASISATLGGSDSGDVVLRWGQGPQTDGYFTYLPGNAGPDDTANDDISAYLTPASSDIYYSPAAHGFDSTGFETGQWVLYVQDPDAYNNWGGDEVVLEQGYNLVAGLLTPVGSSVAIDLTTNSIVTGTESITTFGYIAGGPNGYASGGLLDLSDNDLIVHNGNLNTIAGLLANGYDSGSWDAYSFGSDPEPAAIDSTTALNDAAYLETLGYAQIGSAAGDLNLSTFDAQPVSTGDVIVKFTYYGDANLDGNVNSADQSMMSTGLSGWTNGDFNYDGTVDGSDYSLLDTMTHTLTGQNQNVPSGTITLAANADFPVGNLPTKTPSGSIISSWLADFGNGYTETFSPTDTVSNLYADSAASYIATLLPLDANGNPEYYYPHMTVNLTYVTPPSQPTGLTVLSVLYSEVDLSWTNNSSTANSVDLLISTNGINYSTFAFVPPTQSTFAATNLSSGATYYFEVQAADQNLPSAVSNAVSAETLAVTAPTLSLSQSDATISLSWNANPEIAPDYELYVSLDGGETFNFLEDISSTVNTTDLEGLSPSTTYVFEIAADEASGVLSAYSNTVSASTPTFSVDGDTTVADQTAYTLNLSTSFPSGASANLTNDNYVVNWGDGSITQADEQQIAANLTSISHTFAPGVAAANVIVTFTDGVTSFVAGSQSVTITGLVVPSIPTSLTGTASSGGVALSWSDSSPDIRTFIVDVSQDDGATFQPVTILPGAATTYNATLPAVSDVIYRVIASNDIGGSDPAEVAVDSSSVTPDVTPGSSNLVSPHILDIDDNQLDGAGMYNTSQNAYQISAGQPFFVSAVNTIAAATGANSIVQGNQDYVPSGGSTYNASAGATPINTSFAWNFGDTAIGNSDYESGGSTLYNPNSSTGTPDVRVMRNQLIGFNAAHIYDTSGTYELTLTATDLNGNSSTVFIWVKVVANTYGTTAITVPATGSTSTADHIYYVDTTKTSGANNGRNPANAFTSLQAAFSAVASNNASGGVQIRLMRGENFNATNAQLTCAGSDVLVGSYGSLTASCPIIIGTATGASPVVFAFSHTAKDWLFQDLAFREASGLKYTIFTPDGTNLAVRNCQFDAIDTGVAFGSSVAYPEGMLIQDCDIPEPDSSGDYALHTQGSDWVIIGNTFLGGTTGGGQPYNRIESYNGPDQNVDATNGYPIVGYPYQTVLPELSGKNLIEDNIFNGNARQTEFDLRGQAAFSYFGRNTFYTYGLNIGDQEYDTSVNGVKTYYGPEGYQIFYTVVSDNKFMGDPITIAGDVDHIALINNVIEILTTPAPNSEVGIQTQLTGGTLPDGASDSFGLNDLRIINNTYDSSATGGKFIWLDSTVTGGSGFNSSSGTFDTGVQILNNLEVTPNADILFLVGIPSNIQEFASNIVGTTSTGSTSWDAITMYQKSSGSSYIAAGFSVSGYDSSFGFSNNFVSGSISISTDSSNTLSVIHATYAIMSGTEATATIAPGASLDFYGNMRTSPGSNIGAVSSSIVEILQDTGGSTYILSVPTADALYVWYNILPPQTGQYPATPPSLAISLGASAPYSFNISGGSSLTVDFSMGINASAGTIIFNGTSASLSVIGTENGTGDTIKAYPSMLIYNNLTVQFPTALGYEAVDPLSGVASLTTTAGSVNSPYTVHIPWVSSASVSVRQFAKLNISTGSSVVFADAPTHAQRTLVYLNGSSGALYISGTGTLDLGGNDMAVQGGSIQSVFDWLQMGINLAAYNWWTGDGITSSDAAADPTHLTAIGSISVIGGTSSGERSSFDGLNLASGVEYVLLKYTYYGDATLQGYVNGVGYSALDTGYSNGLTGWANGDFDYDGVLNGDDYTLLDNAHNTQGPAL